MNKRFTAGVLLSTLLMQSCCTAGASEIYEDTWVQEQGIICDEETAYEETGEFGGEEMSAFPDENSFSDENCVYLYLVLLSFL